MIASFIHNVKGDGTLIPLRYQVHFDCNKLEGGISPILEFFSLWWVDVGVSQVVDSSIRFFVTLKAAMTAKFKATLVVTYIQTRILANTGSLVLQR